MREIKDFYLKSFYSLLCDERVRTLLEKKSIILESIGSHNYYFIVVNIYYGRFRVKIARVGLKASCDSRCEAFTLYGLECYHIKACRAFLLLQRLLKLGFTTEELLYNRVRV